MNLDLLVFQALKEPLGLLVFLDLLDTLDLWDRKEILVIQAMMESQEQQDCLDLQEKEDDWVTEVC